MVECIWGLIIGDSSLQCSLIFDDRSLLIQFQQRSSSTSPPPPFPAAAPLSLLPIGCSSCLSSITRSRERTPPAGVPNVDIPALLLLLQTFSSAAAVAIRSAGLLGGVSSTMLFSKHATDVVETGLEPACDVVAVIAGE